MNQTVLRLIGCGFLVPVLGLLLILVPSVAVAKPSVHFAGFAYAGPYAGIATSFPYTAELDPPTGASSSPFDARLRAILSQQSFPGFTLNFTSLGNSADSDSLAMALVLNNESVSVERIQDNLYKLLVTLDAQALFFDAKQMQIIASYPFGLDYVDALSVPPTKEYIASVIRKIYLGGASADLFTQFGHVLSGIELKPRYGNTIQVTDVQISNEALQMMPTAMQGNVGAAQALLATQFADYLSKNADVPVLPYAKGYAVGNKIATSFADGEVFNLAIPTPDYSITLGIRGFKKVLYGSNAGGSSWIYGAFASFKVTEPLSNRVYMNVLAKNGAVKIIPASQSSVADWPAYNDSLDGLMDQITQQFAVPDQAWIKDHTGDDQNVTQFHNVMEILKSCQ